ncbi:MAG: response regulator [Acidobacteriota bacterium]|jgi:CheY-like chemotaxis protein
MASEETRTAGSVKYMVTCYNCSIPFDAMEASWCSCITTQRTLVCPHCFKCFCTAPKSFKAAFWSKAPTELWQHKVERPEPSITTGDLPEPSAIKHPLVLVVEDERELQRVAALAVESLGYSVLLAANGIDGLEMAKKYQPELILTDALMPRLDGREMCRRLKEDPATSKVKVIVMTSVYKSSKYASEAKGKFHVDAYLDKPVEFNKLRGLLQEFIR